MPSFTVSHETEMSPEETFSKVSDYFKNSEGLKKLDANLNSEFDPSNKSGKVKGSKFECDLKVLEGEKTKVVLQISIPMLLTPFRSTIESTLKDKMTKILG